MTPHLMLALLMWIPRAPAPPSDLQATLSRFEKECLGKGGAPCEALQAELERALFRELTLMFMGGKDPDRRLLRVAARAQLPELAAFGLRRLARWRNLEDVPLAKAGLESASPAVRSAALELAQALDQPQLLRLAERSRGAGTGSGTGLVPMEVPDLRRMGLSLYPGSTYSFAASREDLAVYTTGNTPDQVVAHYAKGRRVLSGAELDELRHRKGGRRSDEARGLAIMQAVMNGKDPQVVMKELMESAQTQHVDWTKDIEGVEGILAPRYVVLEEVGPDKQPSRVLAVYRDEALGGTALAFRLLPPLPAMADPDKVQAVDVAYLQALQELQMRRE